MAVWPDLLGPEHGGRGRAGAATGHTSWSAAVIRRLRVGQFGNRDQYRLEATYYLTPLPVDGGAGLGRDGDQAPMAILHAGLPRRTGGCCYCWAGPGWWLPSRVRAGSGSDMAAVASGSSVPAVAAGSVRLVSRPAQGSRSRCPPCRCRPGRWRLCPGGRQPGAGRWSLGCRGGCAPGRRRTCPPSWSGARCWSRLGRGRSGGCRDRARGCQRRCPACRYPLGGRCSRPAWGQLLARGLRGVREQGRPPAIRRPSRSPIRLSAGPDGGAGPGRRRPESAPCGPPRRPGARR
jgi:hypothetical protein